MTTGQSVEQLRVETRYTCEGVQYYQDKDEVLSSDNRA